LTGGRRGAPHAKFPSCALHWITAKRGGGGRRQKESRGHGRGGQRRSSREHRLRLALPRHTIAGEILPASYHDGGVRGRAQGLLPWLREREIKGETEGQRGGGVSRLGSVRGKFLVVRKYGASDTEDTSNMGVREPTEETRSKLKKLGLRMACLSRSTCRTRGHLGGW